MKKTLHVFLIIVFLCMAYVPVTVYASGKYLFDSKWPTSQWYFSYPEGVVVNSSGNIYVADTLNHRMQKFRVAQQATAVTTMTAWGMIMFMVIAGIGSTYYLKRDRTKIG